MSTTNQLEKTSSKRGEAADMEINNLAHSNTEQPIKESNKNKNGKRGINTINDNISQDLISTANNQEKSLDEQLKKKIKVAPTITEPTIHKENKKRNKLNKRTCSSMKNDTSTSNNINSNNNCNHSAEAIKDMKYNYETSEHSASYLVYNCPELLETIVFYCYDPYFRDQMFNLAASQLNDHQHFKYIQNLTLTGDNYNGFEIHRLPYRLVKLIVYADVVITRYPDSLKELYIGKRFKSGLDINLLSSSIQVLTYHQSVDVFCYDYSPLESLSSLVLVQINKKTSWMVGQLYRFNSLKTIYCGENIKNMYSIGNSTHVILGRGADSSLKLPDTVSFLETSNGYSGLIKLPPNVSKLVVGGGVLPSVGEFPESLKELYLSGAFKGPIPDHLPESLTKLDVCDEYNGNGHISREFSNSLQYLSLGKSIILSFDEIASICNNSNKLTTFMFWTDEETLEDDTVFYILLGKLCLNELVINNYVYNLDLLFEKFYNNNN